jgi:hypothetical protein
MTPTTSQRFRRGAIWLAAGAATLGIGVGAAGLASAASSTTDPVTTVTTPVDAAGTNRPDPASLPNGPGETVLTGDDLTQVTAAAEAASPGATIIRAETDSSGHAFEVHVQLADGSYQTLYFDESFVADGTDDGFGQPPAGMPSGQHGQLGQPPAGMPGQPPAGQPPADAPAGSTVTG